MLFHHIDVIKKGEYRFMGAKAFGRLDDGSEALEARSKAVSEKQEQINKIEGENTLESADGSVTLRADEVAADFLLNGKRKIMQVVYGEDARIGSQHNRERREETDLNRYL